MGVSGAGKTTVGQLLADEFQWIFADADDYHSAANIEKMRTGIALTDDDREPWLRALHELIAGWIAAQKNAVLACSALKRAYRERLHASPEVFFVYLKVSPELLRERLRSRRGHFMTEKMLASQLQTFEEPQDALTVDADGTPSEIVSQIKSRLALAFPPGKSHCLFDGSSNGKLPFSNLKRY